MGPRYAVTLAGHDENKWKQAACAAERAITSRIKLWDRVQAHLKNGWRTKDRS